MSFILGKKVKMSQIFDEKRNVIPVTIIEAGPCYILKKKDKNGKDGYSSSVLGFKKIEKEKKIKKTMKGMEFKYIKEFRGENDFKEGEEINVSLFKEGEKVKVQGFSKGKGFAGAVKRWNFTMQPASHGNKHTQRALGSTGRRFPQRVTKGRKMPGRLGYETVTVKNLKVVSVDTDNNIILLKGAVPGASGTLIKISKI